MMSAKVEEMVPGTGRLKGEHEKIFKDQNFSIDFESRIVLIRNNCSWWRKQIRRRYKLHISYPRE